MSDKLDKALGLPDEEPKRFQLATLPTKSVEEDFDFARSKIYETIETAASALDDLKMLAKTSQHPRAYEVLATLAKNIVEANKDLLVIHQKKKEITEKPADMGPTTINNHLHMTTAEFQEYIERHGQQREA